jgi:hypothetical protein
MKVFDLILRGRFSLISKRNFVKEAKVAPFPCDVSQCLSVQLIIMVIPSLVLVYK